MACHSCWAAAFLILPRPLSIADNRRVESTRLAHATAGSTCKEYPAACTARLQSELTSSRVARRVLSPLRAGASPPALFSCSGPALSSREPLCSDYVHAESFTRPTPSSRVRYSTRLGNRGRKQQRDSRGRVSTP